MMKLLLFTIAYHFTNANATSDVSHANIPNQTIHIVGEVHFSPANRKKLINLALTKKIILFEEGSFESNWPQQKVKIPNKILERKDVPIYELEHPLVILIVGLLQDTNLAQFSSWLDKTIHSILQTSSVQGIQERFESLMKENPENLGEVREKDSSIPYKLLGYGLGYRALHPTEIENSKKFRMELLDLTLKQCLKSCDPNVLSTFFFEGSPTRKMIEGKIQGQPPNFGDNPSLYKERDLTFANSVLKVLKEHEYKANVPIVLIVGDFHTSGVANYLAEQGFKTQMWKIYNLFGKDHPFLQFFYVAGVQVYRTRLENQREFEKFLKSTNESENVLDWLELHKEAKSVATNSKTSNVDAPKNSEITAKPVREKINGKFSKSLLDSNSSMQMTFTIIFFLKAAIY